jgi:hypothetical protein
MAECDKPVGDFVAVHLVEGPAAAIGSSGSGSSPVTLIFIDIIWLIATLRGQSLSFCVSPPTPISRWRSPQTGWRALA